MSFCPISRLRGCVAVSCVRSGAPAGEAVSTRATSVATAIERLGIERIIAIVGNLATPPP
jgi:hypothetical protein